MKGEEFFDMVLTQNSRLVKEVADSILNAMTCEKDASDTKNPALSDIALRFALLTTTERRIVVARARKHEAHYI